MQVVLEKNVQTVVKAASQKVASFSVQQNGCMHRSSLLRLHLWRDGKDLSLNSVSCLNLLNKTTFQGQTTTDVYFEVPPFIKMLQYVIRL